MFIDTHAHLDFDSFDKDREVVIQRAIENKVSAIITIGTSLKTSIKAVSYANNYASIFAAVGIHPSDCKEASEKDYQEIEKLAAEEKVLAIGEIGLDYYHMYTDKETQKAAFIRQITIAKKVNLPVIVHTRESQEDAFKILLEENANKVAGVFHSFSGNMDFLERVLESNFYVSFTGGVTFKKSTIDDLVKKTPIEKILLETDSPFITPVPHRGKRNEPSYVTHIASKIAELKGISIEKLADITTENARHLFGFSI